MKTTATLDDWLVTLRQIVAIPGLDAGAGLASLRGVLQAAVRDYPDCETAFGGRAEQEFACCVRQLTTAWTANGTREFPWSDTPYLAHVALMWDMGDVLRELASAVRSAPAAPRWAMFLANYGVCVTGFGVGSDWPPAPRLSLRGYEKYWQVYIDVMADFKHRRDVSSSVATMRESFAARNRKPLSDDGIDGSSRAPVNWDFRGESILRHARRHYGWTE